MSPPAGTRCCNGFKRATRLISKGAGNCFHLFHYLIIKQHNKTNIGTVQYRAGGDASSHAQRGNQSGIALITAILVVALASIAATAILVSTDIAIHRTTNLQDSEKAWWYAEGVESWVKSILQRDAEMNKTDSFADIWAQPVDYLPIDQGFIRGRVEDLQGRFNLNNFGVQDPRKFQLYVTQFGRLLQNIQGADPSIAEPLADAIHDWIDTDSNPTGSGGAEDSEYLTYTPPYRTANRPLTSVSEVLAIKGMTKTLFNQLTHCGADASGRSVALLPCRRTPLRSTSIPHQCRYWLRSSGSHRARWRLFSRRASHNLRATPAPSSRPRPRGLSPQPMAPHRIWSPSPAVSFCSGSRPS